MNAPMDVLGVLEREATRFANMSQVDAMLALHDVRDVVADLLATTSTLLAGLPAARHDQPAEKHEEVLAAVLGKVNARVVMHLRAVLSRAIVPEVKS